MDSRDYSRQKEDVIQIMHILFIAPTTPIPSSGGRTRLFNLVRQLSETHKVSVISFIREHEYDSLSILEPYCERLELVPMAEFHSDSGWRSLLRGWGQILLSARPRYVRTFPVADMETPLHDLTKSEEVDVAVLHHLFVVELTNQLNDVPTVLAEDNVESEILRLRFEKSSNLIHRVRNWIMWRKLKVFEQRWINRFNVCVCVSEDDAQSIHSIAPTTELHIVPNGVDVDLFSPPSTKRTAYKLLFFGTLSYGPNIEGLLWFCRDIFPSIQAKLPEVELDITGLDPPLQIMQLENHPGINILGFVPDIRKSLWSSAGTVVPIHVAGGTRLKILEALAAECPIVSTTIGAKGLDLIDREHLLVADSAGEFASAVISLLEAPELGREMAKRGRQLVSERFDWKVISPKLENACFRAIELYSSASFSD